MATILTKLAGNHKATLGAGILLFFAGMAIFGPLFVSDPSAFVGQPHSPPFGAHLFGTNGQGQDVLAQTVVGSRMTLLVGFLVGVSVTLIGSLIGVCAGYFGGRIDNILTLFINVFLVIPGLPLAIVIAAYLPAGPTTIAMVLILTGWAWGARVMRSQTLALRNKDFISAAIVSGESHLRIITAELLPNMVSLMVSGFIGSTVFAIGAQVGLEFLGLGNASIVTWGTNLYWASNDSALLTGSWWTFVPTGLCLALIGFGLTLINYAVDEVTNPRLGAASRWKKQVRAVGVQPGVSTPVVRHHG
jgi:peptide/nickel transport system permease protein